MEQSHAQELAPSMALRQSTKCTVPTSNVEVVSCYIETMAINDLALPIPIDELRQTLRAHGIVQASFFGSYARGEQNADSDLDLFVTCRPATSLFDVFDLRVELERQTGIKVYLVTKINRSFSEYIEPDLIDLDVSKNQSLIY